MPTKRFLLKWPKRFFIQNVKKKVPVRNFFFELHFLFAAFCVRVGSENPFFSFLDKKNVLYSPHESNWDRQDAQICIIDNFRIMLFFLTNVLNRQNFVVLLRVLLDILYKPFVFLSLPKFRELFEPNSKELLDRLIRVK